MYGKLWIKDKKWNLVCDSTEERPMSSVAKHKSYIRGKKEFHHDTGNEKVVLSHLGFFAIVFANPTIYPVRGLCHCGSMPLLASE